jgi:hypothetical protein
VYKFLKNLDRRWIFLLMFLSVAIPIIFQLQFPEKPTGLAKAVFDEIEALKPGDPVLLAFDYDPASEGELGPMATSFTYHCAKKGLKLYFMALWPVGAQMIDDNIAKVIRPDFPEYEYGKDYVNMGYKSGYEGVIKVIVTNIRGLFTTDAYGTSIDSIPMMEGVTDIRQMKLIVNVSAGYPGTTEWVQYAITPFPDDLRMVAGCTGVTAPLLYPYIPNQLPGLLGAIKGAAEYEQLVMSKYGGENPDQKYFKARQRMGPQLIAHLLIIFLIVVANILYFIEKRKGVTR